MKFKIMVLLCVLCLAGIAYADTTSVLYSQRTSEFVYSEATYMLDSVSSSAAIDKDTLNFPLFWQHVRGYPHLLILPETVKSGSGTDSLTIQYREAWGPALSDTFANSTWKYVQDYRCGAASVNFNVFDWANSAWYHGILDQDGEFWQYVQIMVTAGCGQVNDSIEVKIILKDIVNNWESR